MDIIEAIERIRTVLRNVPLDVFEADWQRQWLVERGVEIISKASRHLPDEMKARHPEVPWQKVADLPTLEKVCREELNAEEGAVTQRRAAAPSADRGGRVARVSIPRAQTSRSSASYRRASFTSA